MAEHVAACSRSPFNVLHSSSTYTPFHMHTVKRFPTRIRNRFACSDLGHVHTGDFAFVVMTPVTSYINKEKMAVSVTTV